MLGFYTISTVLFVYIHINCITALMKIRIAIVDDCAKYRYAIKRLLHLEEDFNVTLQTGNGFELLHQLLTITPDVILMDIRMPEMDGMVAAEKVRELYPGLKIIAHSQYDSESNIVEMNMRGVKSYIGKEDKHEELFKAIRIVHHGGVYMTDMAAAIVQKHLSNNNRKSCPVSVNEVERKFLKYLCDGLSSTAISDIICRSPRTVEKYREALYKKFEVNSKEQLISCVVKWKLVD